MKRDEPAHEPTIKESASGTEPRTILLTHCLLLVLRERAVPYLGLFPPQEVAGWREAHGWQGTFLTIFDVKSTDAVQCVQRNSDKQVVIMQTDLTAIKLEETQSAQFSQHPGYVFYAVDSTLTATLLRPDLYTLYLTVTHTLLSPRDKDGSLMPLKFATVQVQQ